MDLGSKEFDFRDAAEDGAWCQLMHPVTGEELGIKEGKPVRIKLRGVDSLEFEGTTTRSAVARIQRAATTRGNVSKQKSLTMAEQTIEEQCRELADLTVEWENIDWEGAPLNCSHANALRLYSYKWVREQALGFIAERANYAGNGSTPS